MFLKSRMPNENSNIHVSRNRDTDDVVSESARCHKILFEAKRKRLTTDNRDFELLFY
jgi:hypothetical protein